MLHAVHLVETISQCNNLTVFVLLNHDITVARLALSAIEWHETSQEVLVARLECVEGTPAAMILLAAVQVVVRRRVSLGDHDLIPNGAVLFVEELLHKMICLPL